MIIDILTDFKDNIDKFDISSLNDISLVTLYNTIQMYLRDLGVTTASYTSLGKIGNKNIIGQYAIDFANQILLADPWFKQRKFITSKRINFNGKIDRDELIHILNTFDIPSVKNDLALPTDAWVKTSNLYNIMIAVYSMQFTHGAAKKENIYINK
jgi:hypothetical protein